MRPPDLLAANGAASVQRRRPTRTTRPVCRQLSDSELRAIQPLAQLALHDQAPPRSRELQMRDRSAPGRPLPHCSHGPAQKLSYFRRNEIWGIRLSSQGVLPAWAIALDPRSWRAAGAHVAICRMFYGAAGYANRRCHRRICPYSPASKTRAWQCLEFDLDHVTGVETARRARHSVALRLVRCTRDSP